MTTATTPGMPSILATASFNSRTVTQSSGLSFSALASVSRTQDAVSCQEMFESVDIRQTLRPTFWPTVRLSDNSV
jgi:hypothetical protein